MSRELLSHKSFLGSELPVVQAPMAGVQGSALAIAICQAGGVGSLPCAMLSGDQIKSELEIMVSATANPFNVNFFCHQQPEFDQKKEQQWQAVLAPWIEQYGVSAGELPKGGGRQPFSHQTADVIEPFKPAFVSFHFGLPESNLLARVKSWGTAVLSSATTVEEALWLEAHGADGIIAQGLEAGGHRGMFLTDDLTTQIGTFALLPQIVKAVSLPVIAAGGISDRAGVKSALTLGATAVQMGTAFLLCDETNTTPLHRAAIKGKGASHSAITNVFSGRPARSIVNKAVREIGPLSSDVQSFPLAAVAITEIRKKAEAQGSSDFSPLWCGQNASGCREVSAGVLIQEIFQNI